MKKVLIMTVCNYYSHSFKAEVRFVDGTRRDCKSLQELEKFDTSELRILDTAHNKMGKFVTYSSAEFVNRQFRGAFKSNAA